MASAMDYGKASARHNEATSGRHDKRRHNLILFLVQTELTGEVAAMTIAPVECKQEQLGGGGEL
jgi:hypothetical protein